MKEINVTKSSMPPLEEYIEEIRGLWDSHWLTNMGEKHKKLEQLLKKYLNCPFITLFSNGHLALESIIEALDLKGEVITTPYTFASTTHSIVRKGLTPIFCDINPVDYTIDTNKIEDLITEKTSAIIPVHVYGNICNIQRIESISKKYNLKVIYDAAHAFGVKINGHGVGEYGDASMFSFHATKVFNTIEGGALTYNKFDYQNKLNLIKNFGISSQDKVDYVGGNAKMNEFQAAMGICNLKHVEDDIEKRKLIVERYFNNLEGVSGIKLNETKDNIKSNYAYFPVLFDNFKKSRDQVFDELKGNNIFARKYFYPTTNSFECYVNETNFNRTPIADFVSKRILTLPLYADLNNDEIDRICKIILS